MERKLIKLVDVIQFVDYLKRKYKKDYQGGTGNRTPMIFQDANPILNHMYVLLCINDDQLELLKVHQDAKVIKTVKAQ